MNILYWYVGFNNYFNRKLKYYDSISQYPDPFLVQDNVINFTPGDGVTTTQVCNSDIFRNDSNQTPDYCIVVNEYNTILSRWYVTDTSYSRAGQATVSLKRDSIADSIKDIMKSTVYCSKGYVDVNNPLVYNKEPGWTCNQIKKGEVQLRDNTRCPWIVGYCSRKLSQTSVAVNVKQNYDIIVHSTYDDWEYNPYTSVSAGTLVSYNARTSICSATRDSQVEYITSRTDSGFSTTAYLSSIRQSSLTSMYRVPYESISNAYSAMDSTFISNMKNYGLNYITEQKMADILSYNGKRVRFNTAISGQYDYKYIQVILLGNATQDYVPVTAGNLFDSMKTAVAGLPYMTSTTPNNYSFKCSVTTTQFQLTATNLEAGNYTVDISPNHSSPRAAGYDIFCMPYGDIYIANTGSTDPGVNENSQDNVNIMTQIATELGSNLYDLQMLPYCPIPQLQRSLDIAANTDIYTTIKSGETVVNYLFWASDINVNYDIYVNSLTNIDHIPFDVTEPHTQENCDMYRIVSPNYSGQFEFSVAKNGGVKYFSVAMSMKPYNPFIRVAPNFKELYGREFRDARGLVCGGDFSLPIVTDQFVQYEINNKNYANIFDRQIQNMEFNNTVAQAEDIVGAITGTLTGAASGGAMMYTSGFGALGAGAAIGAGITAASGVADIVVGNLQRREQMSYAKDMYNMNLGNVQALPYTLTKVSAFNYINKIFPLVEYYSCTEEERLIFNRKIKFEGMTVGAIGTLKEFTANGSESYFKGSVVIWNDDYDEDYHMANDASSELEKGIRIDYAKLSE